MNANRIINELEKHGYAAVLLPSGCYRVYSPTTGMNHNYSSVEVLELILKLNQVVL